jgi:outer membrane biosynthesis protein TonB
MAATHYEPMALDLHLPWELDEQREAAFRRLLKRLLIGIGILCLIIPWLPTLEDAREFAAEELFRTQVLLEPVAEPEPEPVPVEPEPLPEPTPEPEPVAPQPRSVPQPASAPAEPEPAPQVDRRSSLAASQGLNELSSQLNAARASVNVASLQRKNLTDASGGEVARVERSRLGEEMTSRSDGAVVDDSVMRSDITALSAHQAAQVEGLSMSDMPAGGPQSHRSGGVGHRDMESIRQVLERAKGSIYTLYQRELQENPGLTGEFTFKLVIEPNGRISDVTLLVSELGVRDLERAILARIQEVNFGEQAVPPTVVEYRFVFLPS